MGISMYGSQQEWMMMMETGIGGNGFCDFYPYVQQEPQQMVQAQGVVGSNSSPVSMGFSQSFAANAEKQNQEIDQFIALQSQRLRRGLQEQKAQHVSTLMRKLEPKTLSLLQQKDGDLLRLNQRSMELANYLQKLEMENQTWQRQAKENEAMAISLNKTLEQLKQNTCCSSNVADDAESCCEFTHEGSQRDKKKKKKMKMKMKMSCKGCNAQQSCMLFLPCRHLCSCKNCEFFFDYCPVCKTVKKACIEVFLA
ncbi:hypothetical protein GIB67_015661 [Kingdonia uniflora]|uniref:RING-type domain-containing protein n=1 Tax=Kingdonia uniflora TaxID=39325 RepID=A0A7J7NU79_9MAGN|nr:hypothetical protein GIB67_015661 [Kingdonia uniflora]